MTREEAKDFLINISYKLSNMAVEYLTEKDGEKMREAIKTLDPELKIDATPVSKFNLGDNVVYGTDGNLYKITVSSGKEYEQEPCDVFDKYGNYKYPSDVELTEPNTATSMPCDDAISRRAVLDEAFEVDTKEYGRIEVVGVDAINSLPSSTPQPKTGHWEWAPYDYNPKLGNWYCSECGSVVIECVSKEEKGGIPLYKYCPQCGRKMQERSDKE